MNGEKKKPFDKSKVKCYDYQKLGHFVDECELPKKDKSKGKEKVNMSQEEEEDKEKESSLQMAIADEHVDVLLQGMSSDTPIDDMWYLDMSASSHMTCMKTFHQSLDESHKGDEKLVMVLQLGMKAKVKNM